MEDNTQSSINNEELQANVKMVLEEIKELKELYQEKIENDKEKEKQTASKTSENAEKAKQKQEELTQQEATKQAEEQAFRKSILEALQKVESSNNRSDEQKTLENIQNELIIISENTEHKNIELGESLTYADLGILFFLLCVLPVIAIIKFCDYFFRDVIY
ncbi:hypothetical protein HRD78_01030 [Enterococcus faecalis]|nr:hypothetical protein [Enterococcus faecalis]